MDTHLTEMELDRFLAGEGEVPKLGHLMDCESCRTRLGEVVEEEWLLRARLYRLTCPPSLALFEHLGGIRRSPAIELHLDKDGENCPFCREEAASLAHWQGQPLVVLSSRLLRERARALVARLLPPLPRQHALRGEARAPQIYDAGDVTLLLDRLPSISRVGTLALHGSLLVHSGALNPCEGGSVTLSLGDSMVREVPLTSFGSFSFEALLPGTYRLTIRLPELVVIVEQLLIEDQAQVD